MLHRAKQRLHKWRLRAAVGGTVLVATTGMMMIPAASAQATYGTYRCVFCTNVGTGEHYLTNVTGTNATGSVILVKLWSQKNGVYTYLEGCATDGKSVRCCRQHEYEFYGHGQTLAWLPGEEEKYAQLEGHYDNYKYCE
jgi:hypothetical protein